MHTSYCRVVPSASTLSSNMVPPRILLACTMRRTCPLPAALLIASRSTVIAVAFTSLSAEESTTSPDWAKSRTRGSTASMGRGMSTTGALAGGGKADGIVKLFVYRSITCTHMSHEGIRAFKRLAGRSLRGSIAALPEHQHSAVCRWSDVRCASGMHTESSAYIQYCSLVAELPLHLCATRHIRTATARRRE